MTDYVYTENNADGMAKTDRFAARDFRGLCFANLVDFDMLYGHRRDPKGYADALTAFDHWYGNFKKSLREEDLLIVTADHGCDPAYTRTTDHTREYVPLIVYSKHIRPQNLGVCRGFDTVAATVADFLEVPFVCDAESIKEKIL